MATTSCQFQGVYDVTSCLVPCSFLGVSIWGSLSEGVFFVCFSVLGGPDRDPLYGEERALRILLEYILFQVSNYFIPMQKLRKAKWSLLGTLPLCVSRLLNTIHYVLFP